MGAGEESTWMNEHRNSKRFQSLGRKEKNNKTLMDYISSVMSAEELGSGPRNFALSPGACFSSVQVEWASPVMGHLLSFHIPSCIKMTNLTYRWGHRYGNLSNSANWVSADESIYCGEKERNTEDFASWLCYSTLRMAHPAPGHRLCSYTFCLITPLKGAREMLK